MKLFAFDRDGTIAVNSMDVYRSTIPLEWVQYLAHETDHEVWAIGNQKLKSEAGIPGIDEMIDIYKDRWGSPIEQVVKRDHERLETPLGDSTSPDPDIISALAKYERTGKTSSIKKHQRMRLLKKIRSEPESYICTDNRYLGYVHGWEFYLPHEFVSEFDDLERSVENISSIDIPERYRNNESGDPNQSDRLIVRFMNEFGKFAPQMIKNNFEQRNDKTIPIRYKKK